MTLLYVLGSVKRISPARDGRWHSDNSGEFMMNIRNFIALMLIALLLGGVAVTATGASKDTGGPKAVFAATRLTFPTVVDGVVITREFTVKNVGSADLRIDKIKTG
jgi:hypothetical protein